MKVGACFGARIETAPETGGQPRPTESLRVWARFWRTWRSSASSRVFLLRVWTRFWMLFAGLSPFGRLAARLAGWFVPPYYGRSYLAGWGSKSYVAPTATISHADLRLGPNVFIDDGVLIFQAQDGGPVELGPRVHLYRDTVIQTAAGGRVSIGAETQVQLRCIFSAFKGSVRIGCGVQIAPHCAFYPYDHGITLEEPISRQAIATKGDIVIDDDAWLGVGATVLSGVRIGKGAVIGAGAVVTSDVPDGAIAVGVPARVVKRRAEIVGPASASKAAL